jgi:geranylgeranyl pyrophosphate synthase
MLDILAPIQAEMHSVEQRLADLDGSANAFLVELNNHLFSAGGKRLRPAAFLLGCKFLGYTGTDLVDLASAFEYIHAASLLHDDVIDKATTRRNHATVNARWGDTVAILLGDRNYALACRVFVRSKNFELIDTIARCIQEMSEGEIFQLKTLWDRHITLEQYEVIARGKTAVLFEACTIAPALLAAAPERLTGEMARFGHSLGMAFQIIDDCLDLVGEGSVVGKPLLADLIEGKVTLPLILGMEGLGSDSCRLRDSVAAICESRKASPAQLAEIQDLVKRTGGLDRAKAMAEQYTLAARSSLEAAASMVPQGANEAYRALTRVVDYFAERTF